MISKRIACCIAAILVPVAVTAKDPTVPQDSYQTVFEGLTFSRSLRTSLRDLSLCHQYRSYPPESSEHLERRALEDISRLETVLQSKGYYEPVVTSRVETQKTPWRVVFAVKPGSLYTIDSVDIRIHENGTNSPSIQFRDSDLRVDRPAHAKRILQAEQRLLDQFRNNGYPGVAFSERTVQFDSTQKCVHLSYKIQRGQRVYFGPVCVFGQQNIREVYVLNRVIWKLGDPLSGKRIQELEKDLLLSGRFSSVRIKTAETTNEASQIPVIIQVFERKSQTLKLGVGYATDVGMEGKVSWEHRNLFGAGERLVTSFQGSGVEYDGGVVFEKEGFTHPRRKLSLQAEATEENTDAYISREFIGVGLLEQRFGRYSKVSAGSGYKQSTVDQFSEQEGFNLFFVPASTEFNTTDDLLDPRKGSLVMLNATPYQDVGNTGLRYFNSYLELRKYIRPFPKSSLVLAARGAVGSISGASRDDIPANDRYYSGGGGSVRGYEYQTIGELVDGQPVGGRSLLEGSLEIRTRPTDKVGAVLFLDGGSAYESIWPDDPGEMLWGAGVGLRYFTPVGPVRVDIAAPLDQREGIDEPFQFYVSLGQTF